jgi:GNAT superfamily N-acetyltransferase
MSGAVQIRPATRQDVQLIYTMICELAAYERAPDAVSGTPAMLERALFDSEPPVAEALIAHHHGAPAAFALFHATFSTWECSAGVWLEDIFVRPEHRRAGVGEALMRHLAALTLARGGRRLEWAALDWNEPALRFYLKLGASALTQWRLHRLDGEALRTLGSQSGPPVRT